MGQLVRVLPGLYATRPSNFAELSKQKELYFIFYALNYALRAGQTEIVSHQPVPDWAKPYPMMRHRCGDNPEWKIVSASSPLTVEELLRAPTVRGLTPEQRKLSIHQLWPPPVMVRELARGWTPERAEELEQKDRAEAQVRRASQSPSGETSDKPMRHYLYFPEKSSAENAGQRLRRRGFSVEVSLGADGENWLALATGTPSKGGEEMEKLRDEIEALAAELDGDYDGWELAV